VIDYDDVVSFAFPVLCWGFTSPIVYGVCGVLFACCFVTVRAVYSTRLVRFMYPGEVIYYFCCFSGLGSSWRSAQIQFLSLLAFDSIVILPVRSPIVAFLSSSVRFLFIAVCFDWGFFGLSSTVSPKDCIVSWSRLGRFLRRIFLCFQYTRPCHWAVWKVCFPDVRFRCILAMWLPIDFFWRCVMLPLCVKNTIAIGPYPDAVLVGGYSVSYPPPNPPPLLYRTSALRQMRHFLHIFVIFWGRSSGGMFHLSVRLLAAFSVSGGDMVYGSGHLVFVYFVVALLKFPGFLSYVAPYSVSVDTFGAPWYSGSNVCSSIKKPIVYGAAIRV